MKSTVSERLLTRLHEHDWSSAPATPKYAALVEALSAAIREEGCAAGDRLPGEAEMAAQMPFSLGTVQRAMRELVESGLVERRQGDGTYVRKSRRVMDDPLQCRFVEDDGVSLLPIYPRVMERVRIAQRGPWSVPLGQKRDNLLRVDRIIDVGSEFAVFARFYVRVDRFPKLETMPASALDGMSLTRLLVRKDTRQIEFDQSMLVSTFPDWICRAINLKSGTTGLVLRTFASNAGQPLYYQELFVPPTRWALKVN